MDVSTMTSLISPDMVETVSDMFQLAIMCCDRPPKAIAADIGYSVDAIYSACKTNCKNARPIPAKARQKLSQINLIAASAIALEATGFKRLFGYQKVDRHIQSMILRLKVLDQETDKLLDQLPVMLLDKQSQKDLTEEELKQLNNTARKLTDLCNSYINLIMELEVKYKLGVTEYLQEKEKSPVLAHRRSVS